MKFLFCVISQLMDLNWVRGHYNLQHHSTWNHYQSRVMFPIKTSWGNPQAFPFILWMIPCVNLLTLITIPHSVGTLSETDNKSIQLEGSTPKPFAWNIKALNQLVQWVINQVLCSHCPIYHGIVDYTMDEIREATGVKHCGE